MTESKLVPRSSVDPAYTWGADSVYPNRAAWHREREAIMTAIPALAELAGSIKSAPALKLALGRSEALLRRLGILYFYATMSQAVDTNDAEAVSMVGQAGAVWAAYQGAVAWLEPEVLALGQDTVTAWIGSEAGLSNYRHWSAALFRRQAHVRSAEVEELLGMVDEVFLSAESIHDMLVNADLKFAPALGQELAQSTIESQLSHPDRQLRKAAWESYCDAHLAMGNTLAASLATAVKRDVFKARSRRFDTALDAALFNDNLPRAVFDTTIDTFRKNLSVWHRYWRVKAKAMGRDKLEHCDIWAPLSPRPPRIEYRQGVEWICQAMAPLGADYVATLRKGCLEQRWVDVYPTIGKSAGAFSYGWKGIHPFIMMGWTDDLSSLSTLTHELGHSMHSYCTWQSQADVYASYPIFMAEVASNFHQALTRAWLFEEKSGDRDFQIALIEEAMENLHRYFFIMPTLARFELEFHTRVEGGQGVTAAELNELMAELFAEGYGDGMILDRPREGSTWAQFSHLYMNYYVFQYATGISAAHALAKPILQGDQAAVARYRRFLNVGQSVYPIDALRDAGVDMTTSQAMDSGFAVLSGLVDRLEGLFA